MEVFTIRIKWTDEQLQILKEKYPICTWDELLRIFYPFTKQQISQKAAKLKIKRANHFWTEEQILYLKSNYKKLTYLEMSKFINKPPDAISQKAYKIGLLEPIDGKWSEEDIIYLKENYPYIDNKDLAKYFNRNKHSIIDKAVSLNLKKKVFNKFKDKDINDYLHNVKKYADELGRTPLVSEINNQDWFIMSNSSIDRYLGGYKNVCKILDLDININVFGSVKPAYKSKNNDLCWSKAEKIITDFYIEENFNYKKEVYYRDYCDDKRFNNKSADWLINDNVFVEYFGIMNKTYYYTKAEYKIELCKDNGLQLIQLYPKDLSNLNIIFEDFIPN